MNILLVHNFYQQPGGEDVVFDEEARLLGAHGHRVARFTRHNDAIRTMGGPAMAAATFWNRRVASELREAIRDGRPDVVHVHNTFPLVSPAALRVAASEGGCAVVQTLHNYRLMCPNTLLFRDGRVCESCLGKKLAWPGIVRGCYRGSRAATAMAAASVSAHRMLGTYGRAVHLYIAPTEFARRLFLRGGLPAEKVVVKPHFLDPDPGPGAGGGGAIFVGRLAPGKGVETILAAWGRSEARTPLTIVGDGELSPLVERACASDRRIAWLGARPLPEVYDQIGRASLLVFPSECYETFGRTAVEAFAKGTPVVAADGGATAGLVQHGRTGRHFRAGDPEDLIRQVELLMSDAPALAAMRRLAREEYEARYTGPPNYDALMAIYGRAISSARGLVSGGAR